MAKGAGMLAPGLATMLVVAHHRRGRRRRPSLDAALRAATATTFDRIDSDGCMSTNDTVLLLATGASGVTPDRRRAHRGGHRGLRRPRAAAASPTPRAPTTTSRSRCVTPPREDDAVEVGRAIARNNLFKCAVFGNDPNWGRVLAAVGTTGAAFEPDRLDVAINGVRVCRAGGVGEDRDLVDLDRPRGRTSSSTCTPATRPATIWTNDLTHDYVHENSAYST